MNRVLAEHALPTGQAVQLVQGDLTEEDTDAIVNAANRHLQHGGGVAGAISRKGGPEIQKESEAWVQGHGPVTHEDPAWTSGGKLPARYVIHAVGPVWGDGDESAKLAAAVRGSLRVADELRCQSIALPAISTGIFGFPVGLAAQVIMSAVREYFAGSSSAIRLVKVVVYDSSTATEFQGTWKRITWDAGNRHVGEAG